MTESDMETIQTGMGDIRLNEASDALSKLHDYIENKLHEELKPIFVSGAGNDHRELWKNIVDPWLQELLVCTSEETVKLFGFIGTRGSGKSSLINSIIRHDILPSEYLTTCTASVTYISAWEKKEFQMIVCFINKVAWNKEAETVEEFEKKATESDKKNPPVEISEFKERRKAIFKGSNKVPATEDWASLPEDINNLLEKKSINKSFTDSTELSNDLSRYVRYGQSAYWPIVDRIYIRGPFDRLPHGLSLVDIPGTKDGHLAMKSRIQRSSSQCHHLFYVCHGKYISNRVTLNDISAINAPHLTLVASHSRELEEQLKLSPDELQSYLKAEIIKTARDDDDLSEQEFVDKTVYVIENKSNIGERTAKQIQCLDRLIHDNLTSVTENDKHVQFEKASCLVNARFHLLKVMFTAPLAELSKIENLTEYLANLPNTLTTLLASEEVSKDVRLYGEQLWKNIEHNEVDNRINSFKPATKYKTRHWNTLVNMIRDGKNMPREIVQLIVDKKKLATLSIKVEQISPQLTLENAATMFKEKLDTICGRIQTAQIKHIVKQRFEDLYQSIYIQLEQSWFDANAILHQFSTQIAEILEKFTANMVYKQVWLTVNTFTGKGVTDLYITSIDNWYTSIKNELKKQLSDCLSNTFLSRWDCITKTYFQRHQSSVEQLIALVKISADHAKVLDNNAKEKLNNLLESIPNNPSDFINFYEVYKRTQATAKNSSQKLGVPKDRTILPTNPKVLAFQTLYNLNVSYNLSPLSSSQIIKILHSPEAENGHVYLLSNPYFLPQVIKIGKSDKQEVYERINELFDTSVPAPFKREHSWSTPQSQWFEKLMHALFAKNRITEQREFFFDVDIATLIRVGNEIDTLIKSFF